MIPYRLGNRVQTALERGDPSPGGAVRGLDMTPSVPNRGQPAKSVGAAARAGGGPTAVTSAAEWPTLLPGNGAARGPKCAR